MRRLMLLLVVGILMTGCDRTPEKITVEGENRPAPTAPEKTPSDPDLIVEPAAPIKEQTWLADRKLPVDGPQVDDPKGDGTEVDIVRAAAAIDGDTARFVVEIAQNLKPLQSVQLDLGSYKNDAFTARQSQSAYITSNQESFVYEDPDTALGKPILGSIQITFEIPVSDIGDATHYQFSAHKTKADVVYDELPASSATKFN